MDSAHAASCRHGSFICLRASVLGANGGQELFVDVCEPAFLLFETIVLVPVLIGPTLLVNCVRADEHDFARIHPRSAEVSHLKIFKIVEMAVLRRKGNQDLSCGAVCLEFHITAESVAVFFIIIYLQGCSFLSDI